MGVVGLAFEFCAPLVRIFQIDTSYFMKCPTVANPEGAVQVCACDFVNGPAVSELPGSDGHALTRGLQLVLQTVLVLLGLIELSMSSYATANNMSTYVEMNER